MSMKFESEAYVTIVSKDGTTTVLTYEDVLDSLREWQRHHGRAPTIGDRVTLCGVAQGDRIIQCSGVDDSRPFGWKKQ